MKIRRHSKAYNFIGDTDTGTTFRWGETLVQNPRQAPWPELADISISNHCTKGCDFCYRDSKKNNSFISVQDYELILNQLKHPYWGNVFQVAIGGGEPLEHPDFMRIIDITCEYGIVPNFTTNGIYLTANVIKRIKKRVGAVAISTVDIETIDKEAIRALIVNNIKCNIHYVLNKDNIKQAISIMNGIFNKFLKGINSIIFLTYKPFGRADKFRTLELNQDFIEFVNMIDNNSCSTRIGFDACFVPMLMYYTNVDLKFIDPCECAFFTVYIDENLNISPCSFTNNNNFTYNMREYSAEYIWAVLFEKYRTSQNNHCSRDCKNRGECRGRCPYFDDVTLCYKSDSTVGLDNGN